MPEEFLPSLWQLAANSTWLQEFARPHVKNSLLKVTQQLAPIVGCFVFVCCLPNGCSSHICTTTTFVEVCMEEAETLLTVLLFFYWW